MKSPGLIRKREGGGAGRVSSAAAPIVRAGLRSSSQPLDGDTRDFMEARFGHDFGQVRVHADSRASDSARDVNAKAYTVGKDLVFQAGHYRPETDLGKRLLAHELTHVAQQRGADPGLTENALHSDSELALSQ